MADRPISSFAPQRPISTFKAQRPISGFTQTVDLETDEESFPVTILKASAQGARFLPRAAASLLFIAGVEGPLEELNRTEKFVTPTTTDPFQRKVGEAITGVAQTATTVAAAALTGGSALTLVGVGAGATETARLIQEGQPLDRAVLDGTVTGILAKVTETIPFHQFGKLIKGGAKGPLKTLLKGIAADVGGEVIEDVTKQGLVDPLILDRDFPSMEKLTDTAADTASTALLATLMLGGGATALGKFGQTKLNVPFLDKVTKTKKLTGPISMEELKDLPEKEALDPITQPEINARGKLRTAEELIKATKLEEIDPILQEIRNESKTEFPELELQQVIEPTYDNQLSDVTRTKQEASSMPTPEPVITPSEQAFFDDKVTKSMQESTEPKVPITESAKQASKFVAERTIDTRYGVKAELDRLAKETGDPTIIKAKENLVLRAGASALSDYEYAKLEKDIIGGPIDRLVGTFSKKFKNDRTMFDALIQSKRSQEISRNNPNFKFQEGLTREDFENNIRKIPTDKLNELLPKAKKYWAKMDNILQELVDEGLETQESKDRLSAKGQFYEPRLVLEYLDGGDSSYMKNGKKITVPDSGLSRLSDEGSLKLIESDSMFLMKQAISRKNGRVFNNRANSPMYEFAVNNPENGVVKEVPIAKYTKEGKPVYTPPPTGWDNFSVRVEGETRQFMLPTDIANEWSSSEPVIAKTVGNILHYLSGNVLLKPMATGLNVGFAFAQLPLDSAHIWFTTEQYNPIAPVAMLQMGKDMIETASDAFKREGLFEDYLKNGGGVLTLTRQGRPSGKLSEGAKALFDTLGWLGENTENWTRLALTNRSLKNGYDMNQAVYIARTYLDFNQGGDFIKFMDKGMSPYLNANVQGTRGIFRAFKNNPKLALFKASNIIGFGMLQYLMWNADEDNKEFYRDVPDRDIQGKFLFPLGFSYRDVKGNKVMPYAKVPMDDGQKIFASIGRNLMAKVMGNEVDFDDIKQNVIDLIPLSPHRLMPPTVSAIVGYAANKDFWRNDDIWKGPDVRSDLEKYPYTPEVFVEAGKALGKSPVRLQYAMRQIFTSGNAWTALASYPLKKALQSMPENEREVVGNQLWNELKKAPISKKFIGVTNPIERQLKAMKELQQAENSRKADLKDDFDEVKRGFRLGKLTAEQSTQFLLNQNPVDQKMLIDREKRVRKLEDLEVPNPSFWLNLQGLTPEIKAHILFDEWISASVEGKKQIENTTQELASKKLFGLSSARLVNELNLLIKKRNEQLRRTE